MSNANALVTLAEAREELKEKSQQYDEVLQRRIDALSSTFESETGWALKQRTLTGYRMNGNNKSYALIPIVPVQSVTQIQIRYECDDTTYKTITDTSKFILKGKDEYGHSISGRLQLLDDFFLGGNANVLLNMVVGFATTHPKIEEAKRLMYMQLAYEYRRWQNNEQGLLTRSSGDGNVSFQPQFATVMTALLREVSDGLVMLRNWSFVA